MRSAARVLDVDAIPNDHGRPGEPERHADIHTEPIAARHCITVAHRERHADDRPCEPDSNTARACTVLRG